MLKWLGGIIAAVIVSAAGWWITTEVLPPMLAKPRPVVMNVSVKAEDSAKRGTAARQADIEVHNDGKALAEACWAEWQFDSLGKPFRSPQFSLEANGNRMVAVDAVLSSAKAWTSKVMVRCANASSQEYSDINFVVDLAEISPPNDADRKIYVRKLPVINFPMTNVK